MTRSIVTHEQRPGSGFRAMVRLLWCACRGPDESYLRAWAPRCVMMWRAVPAANIRQNSPGTSCAGLALVQAGRCAYQCRAALHGALVLSFKHIYMYRSNRRAGGPALPCPLPRVVEVAGGWQGAGGLAGGGSTWCCNCTPKAPTHASPVGWTFRPLPALPAPTRAARRVLSPVTVVTVVLRPLSFTISSSG